MMTWLKEIFLGLRPTTSWSQGIKRHVRFSSINHWLIYCWSGTTALFVKVISLFECKLTYLFGITNGNKIIEHICPCKILSIRPSLIPSVLHFHHSRSLRTSNPNHSIFRNISLFITLIKIFISICFKVHSVVLVAYLLQMRGIIKLLTNSLYLTIFKIILPDQLMKIQRYWLLLITIQLLFFIFISISNVFKQHIHFVFFCIMLQGVVLSFFLSKILEILCFFYCWDLFLILELLCMIVMFFIAILSKYIPRILFDFFMRAPK